jgi:RNA polymerase sigma-70 factor (ECF subfamily)
MTAFDDNSLPPDAVGRARAGAVDAQEAIYRAFELPVRTLARRLVPRGAAAEDLAQDVFVEVLTSLARFDGRGSFAGWVRTITVRKCLMHLRSPWQRARLWFEPVDAEGTGDGRVVAVHAPAGSSDALDLERALGWLSDVARVVVWLHDVEGYTHAEIGALLGGTASLSKSQLARAHARLREFLEPEGVAPRCTPVSTSC